MGRLRHWFSKRIGYPVFVFGRGARDRKMRVLIDEKRALARRPREELAARQLEMLKPLLIHAGRTVPFYRRRFAEAAFDPGAATSLDDLKRIPPLTKDDLRTQLDELISEGFDGSKLIHRATGGSTGVPVKLYTDEEAFTHWEASEVVADQMSGWRPGDPIALLWGANFEVTVSQSVMGRIRALARNQLILNTFKLDDEILAGFHRQLTKVRPTVLVGYTSALMAMADWLERSGTTPGYPTCSIINAAETLLAWQRERIEHVYGAPVFDRYGARDGGPIAMECEAHNGLHVNVLDLIVEANGGVPGEPQELLITNLNAYGMPVIRYQIGDMAVFSERACPCGRTTPLFERLVGRITDVIHLADGTMVPGELFPHLLKDYPIVEFQVVQHADRSLTIRIVRDEGYSAGHEEDIRRIVADHVGTLPVRFEYVERIDRTRTGKLRPVVSEIQPGGAAPTGSPTA